MRQSLRDLAKFHADRRGYVDPDEHEAYINAFARGWAGEEMVSTIWPNATGAGYWEGVHRKEKAELQ